ncbi:conserved hypothetical protein [Talaromyces stipitatus ATCC 10500]|uniref:Alpha/beta hydrolase n=1 Tax=Talaromyces stipitatus (strain ATCC 10500 / CBS 375.48 / QM 6759 / NRRL 1006) TaxID=441959 RepID=B8MR43_TALSN|nr:uncharacterized protein TSTA_054500 [Talaromyces stipitatus ATCC 10500]EED12938.1 conserved hypothetical protein [Talaromyces stipitatus ATCC 10500]
MAREFLHLRPNDISGMIFVDVDQELNTVEGLWPAPYVDSVVDGLDVFDVLGITSGHRLLADDEWRELMSVKKREKEDEEKEHARVVVAEAARYIESGSVLTLKKQLDRSQRNAPLLGDRPVSVLKEDAESSECHGGREKEIPKMIETYDTLDEKWQRGLLGLSSKSKWVCTEKSGHNIHSTKPELIVQELKWVLENLNEW